MLVAMIVPILVGTIIATNVKQLNGECGTAKSAAVLPYVPHPSYASTLRYHTLRSSLMSSSSRDLLGTI